MSRRYHLDHPASLCAVQPPRCRFPAGFLHPNVFVSGDVCLSILNPQKGYRPNIGVKQ